MSRRRFLSAGCGVCIGATLPGLFGHWASAAESRAAGTSAHLDRPRVRLVFACWTVKQDRPTWPHIGYDMTGEIERVTQTLKRRCPEVEFVPALAHSPEDAQRLLAGGDSATVPVPNRRDIPVGTLKSIISLSGLDESLFRR